MDDLKINDIVFSPNFGIGKVLGFEEIDGSKDTFVVIESREKNFRSLIPIKEVNNFRKQSSLEMIKNLLEKLGSSIKIEEFESKKHRILYFKEKALNQNLENVSDTILELRAIQDRGKIENQILESLITSLSIEIGVVLDVDRKKAGEILNDSFKA
ncbi:MAG: hypothetical protein DRQ88_01520 [Epsilonproteobacteria bacterium]|nr:MAG: hypothetical protein DRQ89_03080 [Campylobacterota bacterium]RLA67756.1 MAG: hypothetical protein DRQ88_01520 [Campylobacterota bacterium]